MIAKSQIMPMLLAACPEFRPAWEKYLQWWEGKETGIYDDLAEFTGYVVDAYQKGETDRFPAIFKVIEQLLSEDNQEIRDAAGLGFLETLQCAASWKPFGNKVFLRWMGPKSMQAWEQIQLMWAGRGSLADVIRAERRQEIGNRKWYEFWKRNLLR